jgi:hypothetical protein
MGWTGVSWLLTGFLGNNITHTLATIFYSVSAIAFVLSGVGLFAKQDWTRNSIIAASIFSTLTILIFWDGKLTQPVERGLLGLLISLGVLVAVAVFKWPSF